MYIKEHKCKFTHTYIVWKISILTVAIETKLKIAEQNCFTQIDFGLCFASARSFNILANFCYLLQCSEGRCVVNSERNSSSESASNFTKSLAIPAQRTMQNFWKVFNLLDSIKTLCSWNMSVFLCQRKAVLTPICRYTSYTQIIHVNDLNWTSY